jgi:hypothetical protein
MKLSKQQKTGLTLLAIALIALVVDRVFLGGGSVPAEASASPNEGPVEPVLEPVDRPEADSPSPTIRLIDRLETLWSQKDLDISQARNVFTLPASWRAEMLPAKPVDRPLAKQDAVTLFLTNHQLQAVVISDQTRCVTINDQILYLGDELDGFELVAVQEDSASFELGTKRAVLRLEGDQ